MSTPAAKRRRVDAANATLRKPFHSPLIKPPFEGSPSKTPEQTNSVAAEDAHSPSSPSAPEIRPSRSLGALRQTLHRASSPLKFKTPIQRGGAKTKGPAEAGAVEDILGEHPGGELLALVKAHRHTAQDAVLKDLDKKLETVRQARRIELASEKERPGEAVDQELRDLVAKWKGASRVAAEELFEIVRERVANFGGPKAWKEMRQRQMEFYQGWDQEEVMEQKKTSVDADGGSQFQEEFEGDDDSSGAAASEALMAKEQADEDEEEQSEPEFNMAQMLQSLNIDLSLLGYDEIEEKWLD